MIVLGNRFFPLRGAVCVIIEASIILSAAAASFFLLRAPADPSAPDWLGIIVEGALIAMFCQSCMFMLDLYDFKYVRSWGEVFFSILFSIGFVFVGFGALVMASPSSRLMESNVALTIPMAGGLLVGWRACYHKFISRIVPRDNLLIVGTGPVAEMVAREIGARESLGFHLVGFLGPSAPGDMDGGPESVRILGDYADIRKVVAERNVRRVIVAISERRGGYPVKEMLALRVKGYDVVEWPAFFERLSGRIPIDDLAPSFFIFNEGFRKAAWHLILRRVLSAMSALVLLLLVLPMSLVVAVLIKIESRGPVFYRQERVGQHGNPIRIWKFRSMWSDAESDGRPRWAEKNDPRVTRLGRFLRRCRIDELPQLINVFRGDLNLIGPRPERPEFVRELEAAIPYYSLRHTIKPGLTGWAQVMYSYCGTVEESKEKFQYDLFYLKNMSFKLDLLILFHTVKIVALGRGGR